MKPEKTKVFITVKTYPSPSTKYDELVCTAGITDKGKWVRIYPIPFRKLKWKNQYRKYQWIELDLIKNKSDFRPESYKPVNQGKTIKIKEFTRDWKERKKIIFKEDIYKNMESLIQKSRENNISLTIFKPKNILDFKIEPAEKDWDPQKIEEIKENSKQMNLFESDKPHEIFRIVKKLPYKFSYVFKDEEDKKSKLMIEDWEIGALYWNCLTKEKNEEKAVQKVRQKYLDEFKNRDLFLFLGTTKQFHNVAPNPFIIIGVFYPPLTKQPSLFESNGSA